MSYQSPLELRISLPKDRTITTGTRSTGTGTTMFVRISAPDLETVREACRILGLPHVGTLVRHCAVKYAEEVIKHRNKWLKDNGHEVDKPNSS